MTQQPVKVREAIIKSWTQSRMLDLRMLAKALILSAHKANAISSPHFGSLSGYTDVPVNWKAADGYEFRFIQVGAGDGVEEISTDVVIVGSGCGGAVCAKNR